MRWKENVRQLEIRDLYLSKSGLLQWSAADDARYVIYAIPSDVSDCDALSGDCDGIDSAYILAVTYDTSYTLPQKYRKGYRIAVTPYDRYGIEWQPAYL